MRAVNFLKNGDLPGLTRDWRPTDDRTARQDQPVALRICLLSYRSAPHCGGQGVYIHNLSQALSRQGHQVDVVTGPPDSRFDPAVRTIRLPCLDLYDPADPFRVPTLQELRNPINLMEWLGVSSMGFPEPFTFGLRAYQFLRRIYDRYDVIHDNQSLSYGVWALKRLSPTIATIHHPITIDRDIAVRAAKPWWLKLKTWRWFSFIGMQKRVARTLSHIITVSRSARGDICRDFKIPPARLRVVPNGINTELFYPLPGVAREPDRVIATNSADIPLKGLQYLLAAVQRVAQRRPIRLVVVGVPPKNGSLADTIRDLNIGHLVHFTGRIDHDAYVRQYARAALAVVPSVYEGFGFPVGEAMACGVPVISTSGGALPEVVGRAGLIVPPADDHALAQAIVALMDDPARAMALGQAGYLRVRTHFTWENAARQTVATYREAIDDHRRLRAPGT